MNKTYTIGVDLGATKIRLGIVSPGLKISGLIELTTDVKRGYQAVKNQIVDAVNALIKECPEPIAKIGIGVPGQVDPFSGEVVFSPNLNWKAMPFLTDLQAYFSLPVSICHDVRAAAWAEWKHGSGKKSQDLVCLFIGTGIGAGIVSGGQLLHGASHTCGEVGHMSLDFRGPVCACGRRGCFEAFVGGIGIARQAERMIQKNEKGADIFLSLAGGRMENVSAKIVFEAYKQGAAAAVKLLGKIHQALVSGCANLVNSFNPSLLILGGGVIEGFPEMLSWVREGVSRMALKAAVSHLQVETAKLGKDAGLIGAATILQEENHGKNNF